MVKAKPDMNKECADNKILNPLTNRCVGLHTRTGQNVIKLHMENKVKLRDVDVKKLPTDVKPTQKCPMDKTTKRCVTKKKAPKESKSSVATPTAKPRISSFVKQKLKEKAERAKSNLIFEYADEKHKQYCEKGLGKLEDLNVEKTQTTKYYKYTRFYDVDTAQWKTNGSKVSLPIYIFNNNYNKKYKLYDEAKLPGEDWFKKQDEYIERLPLKDKKTLNGYTVSGDTILNNYIRGTLDMKRFRENVQRAIKNSEEEEWEEGDIDIECLAVQACDVLKDPKQNVSKYFDYMSEWGSYEKDWYSKLKAAVVANAYKKVSNALKKLFDTTKDSFWIECVKKFKVDLERIINGAPSVDKPFIVFRGVKDDYFLKKNKHGIYNNEGFISTTMDLRVIRKFTETKCCLKRITLSKGTKCLFLGGVSRVPEECEILLSNKATYVMKNGRFSSRLYDQPMHALNDVCGQKGYPIYVTDIIAA